MGIGVGIFLIAVGAILDFAVKVTTRGFNINTIGLILMIAGVLGIALELLFAILIALLIVAVLFGLGFAAHLLWILAVVVLVFWLAGFAFRFSEGRHWYRW